MRRNLPIRVHLAFFGALIAAPILAAVIAAAGLHVDRDRADLASQAQKIASAAAAVIDQNLNGYKLAMQVLATSDAVREGRFEDFYRQSKQLSDSIPGGAISLRQPTGELIFMTSLPYNASVAEEPEAALRAANRLAVEHRSPVISDLIGTPNHQDFLALAMPVLANGQVQYLLTLKLAPTSLAALLDAQAHAADWGLQITDNADRIIARSGGGKDIGGKASADFIQHSRGDSGSFVSENSAGARLTAYRRSELSGWRIAAVTDVQSPTYRSTASLIVLALGLGASLALGIFYGRYLSKPVLKLKALARATGADQEMATGIAELSGVSGAIAGSIAALEQWELARSSLAEEMNKRMEAMLGVVRAIEKQTIRHSRSLQQFGKSFEERLAALARSHEALGDREFHSSDLAKLIAQTCKPFATAEQVDLDGPPLELDIKAAVEIGMVIHELISNAAKYGALNALAGRVKIRWDLPTEGGLRILRLQWQEEGGPPIQAAHKEGFGTVLLRSIVEQDFGGRVDMIFARDGLMCIVCIPLAALQVASLVPQMLSTEPTPS